MATLLLVDMDVMIDHLCDRLDAISYVEARQKRLPIPVVTAAALSAGVRQGEVVWSYESISQSA